MASSRQMSGSRQITALRESGARVGPQWEWISRRAGSASDDQQPSRYLLAGAFFCEGGESSGAQVDGGTF